MNVIFEYQAKFQVLTEPVTINPTQEQLEKLLKDGMFAGQAVTSIRIGAQLNEDGEGVEYWFYPTTGKTQIKWIEVEDGDSSE